jgi:hypothetical protein
VGKREENLEVGPASDRPCSEDGGRWDEQDKRYEDKKIY